MIKNLFFDTLFSAIVVVLFVSGFFVRPALSSTGPSPVRRTWSAQPMYDFSRNLWGQVEEAFQQPSKKGVLIGNDQWLAANDGFSCAAVTARTLQTNMDYVVAARNLLAERNTTLLVVLIPAKGKAGGAPSCQRAVYAKTLDYMDRHRVPVVDLSAAMRAMPDGPLEIRNGDRLQDADNAAPGSLTLIKVADAGNILTDATRAVQSPFEQYLGAALQADMQNVTGEGQGPFTAMDSYLRNAAWTRNPPELVVWEIPERDLLVRRR